MPRCNSRRVRGIQYVNRNSAFVIESCNDDNDVRKALFPLSESADHCVGADRSRAFLAAKAWIDEFAPQVIEKRMPGMIEPELTAESNARD